MSRKEVREVWICEDGTECKTEQAANEYEDRQRLRNFLHIVLEEVAIGWDECNSVIDALLDAKRLYMSILPESPMPDNNIPF